MKNYVIINGVNSNTKNGLAINELPPITKPQMRTLTEEIDGRDGDIITKLGYSAYDKTITIGLWGTSYDVNDIIAFFNKEGIITFSNEPDKYYKFTMVNEIDIETLLRFKTASITFHCQPFKYPTEETPIEIEYEYVEQDNVESANMTNTEGDTSLKIDLKGNTSQYSTTGKNLSPTNSFTLIRGTKRTLDIIFDTPLPAGTYTISWKVTNQSGLTSSTPFGWQLMGENNQNLGSLTAIYEGVTTTYYTRIVTDKIARIYCYINSDASNDATITIDELMLESGSSATSYEPYTNGASPNPSYPQPINVVSGDNEVVVCGKNLFDKNNIIDNKSISSSTGGTYNDNNSFVVNYINVYGKTKLSVNGKSNSIGTMIWGSFYDENKAFTSEISLTNATTINVPNNAYYMRLGIRKEYLDTLQIEAGENISSYSPYQSQTYPINLGTLELCKIGDYQDYFTKNSGKNLIEATTDKLFLNANYDYIQVSGGNVYGCIGKVKPNTTYTIKTYGGNRYWVATTSNYPAENVPINTMVVPNNIGAGTAKTFTTGANDNYVFCYYSNSIADVNVMLNEGSTSLPYEPYGTGQWCKYNAIQKTTITNDNTNIIISTTSSWDVSGAFLSKELLGYKTAWGNSYTKINKYHEITSTQNVESGAFATNFNANYVVIFDSRFTDLDTARSLLIGTEIDIALATPYLSLIEDNTLIEQLDNIENAMSYLGQTNVSQTNDDKPFLMDLKAMKKDTNQVIVNNIGNTNSKPTIALEGTGDINIYLNGTQMLKATLTDKMTIDTTNLEAYNPDTMTLLNRQLIGDLSKFTLASGNNTIKMDGNLTKATITDYVRYL